MSTDARVHYLEQQTEQLNQHVKLLRQLVTTEVAELRGTMEQQVAEVRQVMMYQDRLYQERIRRLELRIQQLSEFCLHMARSTGHAGAGMFLPSDMAPISSTRGGGDESARGQAETQSQIQASADQGFDADDGDDDDDPSKPKGVKRAIARYQQKIDDLYDFYTTSSIDVYHPSMTITQFSRFVKDTHLVGLDQGTSSELLWMAIMRKLNVHQDRRRAKARRSMTLGKYSKTKKDSFAFERLETIPKALFGDALVLLAGEKMSPPSGAGGSVGRGAAGDDGASGAVSEDAFTRFLLYSVFPYTDSAVEQWRTNMSRNGGDASMNDGSGSAGAGKGSISIQEYKTDAVKAIVKENMASIRKSFSHAIQTAQDYHATSMTLDGFVELIRSRDLLPLISKPDIRQIFLTCSAIEHEKHPDEKDGTLSLGSMILALYHLADRIYSAPATADKFPTAESRMQKLMTKMYLLH